MTLPKPRALLVWLFGLVFVYALLATTVMREAVIPALAPAASGGHLEGDALYYHQTAQAQAAAVRAHGWRAFELRPLGQGSAGIASALYLLWDDPYSVVLLNCLLHALSTVVVALLLSRWFAWPATLFGVLPLALSPYMMLWFSQINKDSCALAGSLIYTFGFVRLLAAPTDGSLRPALRALVSALAGIALIWIVRPYLNQMLLPVSALLVFAALMLRIHRSQKGLALFGGAALALLLALAVAGTGAASDRTLADFDHYQGDASLAPSGVPYRDCYRAIDSRHWQPSALLPDFANRKLRAFAGQRCNILLLLETQQNPTARESFVDIRFHPSSAAEMLGYMPRAALLGVFAPWPDRWLYVLERRASAFYAITPLEALLLYLGGAALALWLWRGGSADALVPVALAAAVMTLYAMATPFIGALYRYRYPWWMLLICLGTAAAASLLSGRRADNGASASPARPMESLH